MNPMIDIYILFAAYCMSVIALGVSLYALYRINEIIEYYRTKPKNTVYVQPKFEAKQKTKPKGIWD